MINHYTRNFSGAAVFLMLIALAGTSRAVQITSTGTGGAWYNAATWVGGYAPGIADTAIIAPGAVIFTSGYAEISYLQMQTGAQLTATGTFAITGNLDIAGGALLKATNTTVVELRGNIALTGTMDFTAQSSSLVLSGLSQQVVAGTGTFMSGVVRNFTVRNASGVLLNIPFAVSDKLLIETGELSGSGILTLGNAAWSSSFTYESQGGMIAFSKPLVSALHDVISVQFSYNASSFVPPYTTGKELSLAIPRLNVSVGYMPHGSLTLRNKLVVNNLSLTDTLHTDTNEISVKGVLTFNAGSLIRGAGKFTNEEGSVFNVSVREGLTAAGDSGHVQTAVRNYSAKASYMYKVLNTAGYTGSGLPDTLTGGTVTISTPTQLSKATVFHHLSLGTSLNARAFPIRINGTGTIAPYTIVGTSAFTSGPESRLVLGFNTAAGALVSGGTSGNIQTTGGINILPGTDIELTNNAPFTGTGFPLTGIDTLVFNGNTVLSNPVAVNTLVIGTGRITSTFANMLTVNKALLRRGTGFITGPLTRVLDSSYTGSVEFPVGTVTGEKFLELHQPQVSGTVSVLAYAHDRNPNGTASTGLTGINPAMLWAFKVSGSGKLSAVSGVKLRLGTLSQLAPYGKIGFYAGATSAGAYKGLGGYLDSGAFTVQSSSGIDTISNLAGDTNYLVLGSGTTSGTVPAGTYTVGPGGNFTSLTLALSELAEYNNFSGNVILELIPGYDPGIESYPVSFNGSLPATAGATLTIRPAASVTSPIRFRATASTGSAVFEFNWNSRYITIDGRPGGAGTDRFIEIHQENTIASGGCPAVKFVNDAQYITLRRLRITAFNSGVSGSPFPGVIHLGGTALGTTPLNGNKYDTIDFCIIDGNAAAAASDFYRSSSAYGIFSTGNPGAGNQHLTISNNDIADCFGMSSAAVLTATGVQLMNHSGPAFITGNRIYQTAKRSSPSSPQPINITSIFVSTAGSSQQDTIVISDNQVGGNIPGLPGSVWSFGDSLVPGFSGISCWGINVQGGYGKVNITGNTISNISLFGIMYVFTGLQAQLSGGIISNNTIGSLTQDHSIAILTNGPSSNFTCKGIHASGEVAVINNKIGGYTYSCNSASSQRTSFTGIDCSPMNTFRVNNNTIGGTGTGKIQLLPGNMQPFSMIGINMASNSPGQVNDNQVGNMTARYTGAQLTYHVTGINCMGANQLSISRNKVTGLSSSSGGNNADCHVTGIAASAGSGASPSYLHVTGNIIYGLRNDAVSGTVRINGITYAGGGYSDQLIANNLVYGLVSHPYNATAYHNGILLDAANISRPAVVNNFIRLGLDEMGNALTTPVEINGISRNNCPIKLLHNTVYIGGSGVNPGTASTFALKALTGLTGDTIINNIFMNVRSNATSGGKHYATGRNNTLGRFATNIYFANGNGGFTGQYTGYDLSSLRQWQSKVLTDSSAISFDPQLANPGGDTASINLRIVPGATTAAEGNGTPGTGIETDFDNNQRSAFSPVDIGASTGNYNWMDVTAPAGEVTLLTDTYLRGNRTVVATITDATGTAVAGPDVPRLYYRKNVNITFASVAGSLVSGTGRSGTWSFTLDTSLIGGINPDDSIFYFVLAQDTSVNRNTGSVPLYAEASDVSTLQNAPPTLFKYKVYDAVNGNYLVGASQTAPNFKTLTEAKNFLNNRMVSGQVNFLLQSDYNSSQEPAFPIVFGKYLTSDTANRVTIKPDHGVSASISGNSSLAVIRFQSARGYVIDGSNNGTSSRDLGIVNLNAAATSAVIWVSSTGPGMGSTNIVIKNTRVAGSVLQNTSSTINYGILSTGTGINETGGIGNDSNQYINNEIYQVTSGIVVAGVPPFPAVNTVIKDNLIGPPYFYFSQLKRAGIHLINMDGVLVSGNEIRFAGHLAVYTPAGTDVAGIAGAPSPWGTGTTYLRNAKIIGNTIHDVVSEKSTSVSGIYLSAKVPGDVTGNVVANNVIYNVRANGPLTKPASGILLLSGFMDTVVFNTVYLSGPMEKQGITATAEGSAAFTIASDSVRHPYVCNNIFTSKATSYFESLTQSVVRIPQNYSWGSGKIDYNNYYVPADSSRLFAVRIGTQYYSLAAWRLMGQNAYSTHTDPLLNSAVNLRPDSNSPVIGAGVHVPYITYDMNNAPRRNPPAMGAFEYASDSVAPVIAFIPLLHTQLTGDRVITATIKDNTGIPLAGADMPRIYFKKGTAGTWLSAQGALAGGTSRNSTWNFTISAAAMGGVAIPDTVFYYIAVQDLALSANLATVPSGALATSVNNVTTAPSSPLSYAVMQGVSGNFLVGESQAAPNFRTLTDAVNSLQGKVVTGPVQFLLQPDYNTLLEPAFPIQLLAHHSSVSPAHLVTIRPDSGVTDTIAANHYMIFWLNGATRYVIDGSNNGTDSRNLTVMGLGTIPSDAFALEGWSGLPTSNNVIKNLNISCSNTGIKVTGQECDSNQFVNNYIVARTGIATQGSSSSFTTYNRGNVYSNNLIGPEFPDPGALRVAGMILEGEDGARVENNEIRNMGIDASYMMSYDIFGIVAGMRASNVTSPPTASIIPSVRNMLIRGNRIHHLFNEKGQSAVGIQVSAKPNAGVSGNKIVNNEIYQIRSNNTVNLDLTAGIVLGSSSNDSVLFNTIALSGDLDPAGTTTAVNGAYGIRLFDVLTKNPVVLNNLVTVDVTSNNAAVYSAPVFIPGAFDWGTGRMDKNLFYINGSNPQLRIGRISNSYLQTAQQWQTASRQDSLSIFTDPLLNVYGLQRIPQHHSPALGAGVHIPGTATDINGDLRANPPAIGAYELPQDASGPVITYIPATNSSALATRTLTGFATITDPNGVDVSAGRKPRIYYKKKGEANVFGPNSSTANGWKWTEAVNNVSPFSFAIDYSLLSTAVALNDTIQYFVAAQEQNHPAYVSASPATGFAAASVAAIGSAPSAPPYYLVVGLPLSGNYNIGAAQVAPGYATLTAAAKDLYLRGVNGPVTFILKDTLYTAAETFPVKWRGFEGASAVNAVIIRPDSGIKTTVSAATATPVFELDSCSYLTVDGRYSVNDTAIALRIVSTVTNSPATIRLMNGSCNNRILHTEVQGRQSSASERGVVAFGQPSTTTGNSYNKVANCRIGPSQSANPPAYGVVSYGNEAGPASKANTGNHIDSCRISDYFSSGSNSSGIYLSSGRNWKITNNRFFQSYTTSVFAYSGHRAISALLRSANDTLLIEGNYIGGSSSAGTGRYNTGGQLSYFSAIETDVESGFVSIQGNTITNIDLQSAYQLPEGFALIRADGGYINIGGEKPNIIGSVSDTGAIVINAVTDIGTVGINVTRADSAVIRNNTIGGITFNGDNNVGGIFSGVRYTAPAPALIAGNLIGHPAREKSIYFPQRFASSTQNAMVSGIYVKCSGCKVAVDSNTVANIYNESRANVNSWNYNAIGLHGVVIDEGSATVTRNKIFKLSASHRTGGGYYPSVLTGIRVTGSYVPGDVLVEHNTIHSLRYLLQEFQVGVNITGIYTARRGTGLGKITVNANTIHSLSAPYSDTTGNNPKGDIIGIYSNNSQLTTGIFNNMIRLGIDENGDPVRSQAQVFGILKENDAVTAAHNSIYIGGRSAGSAITAAMNFSSWQTRDTIMNNILVNNRSDVSMDRKHYALLMNPYNGSYVDHNIYHADSGYQVCKSWIGQVYSKGWVSSDNNSLAWNPEFINPAGNAATVDLHLKTTVPVPAEQAGKLYPAVTRDIDGEERPALSPVDIGADAGHFIMNDLFAPVIGHDAKRIDTAMHVRIIGNVAISDYSPIDTSTANKPRIYFKKHTDHNAFGANTSGFNGWKYVTADNSVSPFRFLLDYSLLRTPVVLGDSIQYFIVAQDASTNSNVAAYPAPGFRGTVAAVDSAPADPLIYRVSEAPLSGTYLVGAGHAAPDYPTITSALYDLNTRGISGPVLFSLTDTNYSTNETFPLLINTVQGASATSRVTIRPVQPLTRISKTARTELFVFQNAAYITIDGSSDGSGNADLTLQSDYLNNMVLFAGTGAGCAYDTLMNTRLINGARWMVNDYNPGVFVGGKTYPEYGTGHHHLVLHNNTVLKSSSGIMVRCSEQAAGIVISDNYIAGGGEESSDAIDLRGAYQPVISGNRIPGFTATNYSPAGIVVGNTNGALIERNTISGINSSGSGVPQAWGIRLTDSLNIGSVIRNNFISHINSRQYAYGIMLEGGADISVLHNTIALNAVWNPLISTKGFAACLAGTGAVQPLRLKVKNNILSNTMLPWFMMGGGTSTNAGIANLTDFSELDYNNYWLITDPSVTSGAVHITSLNTSFSLSGWQAYSGKDANSRNVPVNFVSATDLHLAGSSIGDTSLKALFIPGTDTDIDGHVRQAPFTYMGADENPSVPVPVTLLAFSAARKDVSVLLKWSTASETNNFGFDVERSLDGKSFTKVAFARGSGTSRVSRQYQATDNNAFKQASANVLYYRLKQLDLNGRYTYSETVRVTNPQTVKTPENTLTAYPNPFHAVTTVRIEAAAEGKGMMTMRDLNGKVVSEQEVLLAQGSNEVRTGDLSGLPAGMYFITVITPSGTKVIKVLKADY